MLWDLEHKKRDSMVEKGDILNINGAEEGKVMPKPYKRYQAWARCHEGDAGSLETEKASASSASKKAGVVPASAVEKSTDDVTKVGAWLDAFWKEVETSAQSAIKNQAQKFDNASCETVLSIVCHECHDVCW